MSSRFRPVDIEIPSCSCNNPGPGGATCDCPFKYDELNRKDQVCVLTHVLRTIKGPAVVAVDADWGAGKTTFLKLWAQHLRNTGLPVMRYNAWKTDFANHPLIPLWDELSGALKKIDPLGKHVTNLQGNAKKLIKNITAIHIGYVGIQIKPVRDPVKTYRDTNKRLKEIRGTIERIVASLKPEKPLIILVDELDRCRPSYAIEFLEVAKHLFDIDNIIFVVGINQTQLRHAVGALYGNLFDSEKYLRRFFDHTFSLPTSNRDNFISRQLTVAGLGPTNDGDIGGGPHGKICLDLLKAYCKAPDVSLREIQEMIHHGGLVLSLLAEKRSRFELATVVAIVIRSADHTIYNRITNADISDNDAYEALQANSSIASLPHPMEFEAAVIMACRDMLDERDGTKFLPRLQRYQAEYAESAKAKQICDFIEEVQKQDGFGFRHVVNRLGFLSTRHFKMKP